MAESYNIPGSLNFKRLKNQEAKSTTLETRSNNNLNSIVDVVKKYRSIEGFLNHRLYDRYAASQNYYYLRDINGILGDNRTGPVISYKDHEQMGATEEYLKKGYKKTEYPKNINKLCEYYKFHKEIPRIFAKEVYDTFFDHHDKKRKVEYVIITRKLKEEAGEDLKVDTEKQLKKMREVPFEPLLASLGKWVSYKYNQPRKNKRKRKTARGNKSESLESLQSRLSDIFFDKSVSNIQMQTFIDESPAKFTNFLANINFSKQGLAQTVQASLLKKETFKNSEVSPPKQAFNLSSMGFSKLSKTGQNSLKGSFLAAKGKYRQDQIDSKTVTKAGTVGAIGKLSSSGFKSKGQEKSLLSVKQVKELSAPAPPLSSSRLIPSMLTSSLSPELATSLKKAALPKQGISQSSKQISQAITVPTHALSRPASKERGAARKSSHTSKRSLKLSKKNLDDDKVVPLQRKESSEFRIKKKGSMEIDPSPRKYLDCKKDGYLVHQDDQKGSFKFNKTSTQFQSINKPSLYRMNSSSKRSLLEGNQKNIRSGEESRSRTQLTSPAIEPVSNFKSDIERLLKASGFNETRTSRKITAREEELMLGSTRLNVVSKHKYTRSGPETLYDLALNKPNPHSVQASSKNSAIQSKVWNFSGVSTNPGMEDKLGKKSRDILMSKKSRREDPRKPYLADVANWNAHRSSQPKIKPPFHSKKSSTRF